MGLNVVLTMVDDVLYMYAYDKWLYMYEYANEHLCARIL